jgi:LAO/AO transport system kinase
VVGSSLTGRGIDTLWQAIEGAVARWRADGRLRARRQRQAQAWLEQAVREQLLADFLADPATAAALAALQADVEQGRRLPGAAARDLVARHTRR